MTQQPYQIERYNISTGKAEVTTVTPLPEPIRLSAKPETFTLGQLRKQIDELTEDITSATTDYDHASTHLDEYYADLHAAQKRVAELRAALAEAEADVSRLQAHGSPRDGYFNFLNECEGRVSSITRQLLDYFCQTAAVKTFQVAFSRLTEHTQKDISLVYRIRLERFREGVYSRLRRQERATGDQIKARASELLRDLDTITKENFTK